MTPLHWAVERGCTQTVELLLKHGANTNIESKFDKTPLEIASENGRPDIFEMLQKAAEYRVVAIEGEGGMGVSQQEVNIEEPSLLFPHKYFRIAGGANGRIGLHNESRGQHPVHQI